MTYVPYGRLLTVDQANAVYAEADKKQKFLKKWLTIQSVIWAIGGLSMLFDSYGTIFAVCNTVCYFLSLCLSGMPSVLQFILFIPNWFFTPPLHTLLTLSALKKQKKDCVKFLQANGIY